MWARLHFGDGGTLDLPRAVPELLRPEFEERWRQAHVRVEWMLSPRGRLDHLLRKRSVSAPPFRA